MDISIHWVTKTVFDLIVTSDNTVVRETFSACHGPATLRMFREITEQLEEEFGEDTDD